MAIAAAGVPGRCTGVIMLVVLLGGISNLGVPERLPLDLDRLLLPRVSAGAIAGSLSVSPACSWPSFSCFSWAWGVVE